MAVKRIKMLAAMAVSDLIQRKLTLAAAESCTGGLIAAALTGIPGASAVLIESIVAYANTSKEKRLLVPHETIVTYGAVSGETARDMASGIAKTSGADIGLSATGIAGPGGGTDTKPVGLVYIGVYYKNKIDVFEHHFKGGRERVRNETAETAISHIRRIISNG